MYSFFAGTTEKKRKKASPSRTLHGRQIPRGKIISLFYTQGSYLHTLSKKKYCQNRETKDSVCKLIFYFYRLFCRLVKRIFQYSSLNLNLKLHVVKIV